MPPSSYPMGAVQMTSTADRGRNLDTALRLVNEAADLGAKLVALPENFAYMGPEEGRLATAETVEGPTLGALRELARNGSIFAVYRKIHLFDVNIPDGARYAESEVVIPGDKVVVAPTPLGRIGLTVCYDLRFPELYRKLASLGAEVITIPAAFTLFTGKDHWEVLIRARAIENLCYVVAPAQVGRHSANRLTYGNAMIVDPWGTVLARCPEGEGVCVARFDRARMERARQELPALKHRRL